MKTTEPFKKAIENHLQKVAENDPLFAETLKKEKKNINDCVTYIMNQVKASGCNGFADEEIFNMAIHYYDEDDIQVGKPINGQVVVNHHVELTEEDKKTAKEKAFEKEVEKQREKIVLETKVELTPEDMEKAKKLALDGVVKQEMEKMTTKKKAPKKVEIKEEVEQVDLFS